jgi:hypothetical protein
MAKIIRLQPTEAPRYKYNLEKLLGDLPRTITIGQLVKHLKAAGIPQHTFYRHRALLIDAKSSISTDHLMIYAQVFDCYPEDIVNNKVEAKSIRDSLTKGKRKVKHGLK